LGILLLAAPTVTLPGTGLWLNVKAFVLEAVAIVLTVLVVSRGAWTAQRVRAALLAAPNLAILGFLGWVGLSALRSELPDYSRYEAMRPAGGGLLYVAIVYAPSRRRQLGGVVSFLLLAGSLGGLLAFANDGESDTSHLAGKGQQASQAAGE